MGEITLLLRRFADGDGSVLESLMPLVYDELRRLARYHLHQQRSGHTLSPTALVHEVFLKLVGRDDLEWQSRAQFFAFASRAMRSVLVDYARRRLAQKRRARDKMVTFVGGSMQHAVSAEELLAIDLALDKFHDRHERQASVVHLLFFGGLTQRETALALGVSVPTVKRDWRFARAWLSRELALGS